MKCSACKKWFETEEPIPSAMADWALRILLGKNYMKEDQAIPLFCSRCWIVINWVLTNK